MSADAGGGGVNDFLEFCECRGCGEMFPIRSKYARKAKWCSERCRKAQYDKRNPCVDCGAPTSSGPLNGYCEEPRCPPCAAQHFRTWSHEKIIAAIGEWASIYGEPPAKTDWGPWACRHQLHDDARACRWEEAGGRWPSFNTVCRAFDSWNGALIAAGFTPRAPHGGGGNSARRRNQRPKVAT